MEFLGLGRDRVKIKNGPFFGRPELA